MSSIQLSQSTKDKLKSMALVPGESYENIIIRLLDNEERIILMEKLLNRDKPNFRFEIEEIFSKFNLAESKKISNENELLSVFDYKISIMDVKENESYEILGYVELSDDGSNNSYTWDGKKYLEGVKIADKSQPQPIQGFVKYHFQQDIDMGILMLDNMTKKSEEEYKDFIMD